MSWPFIAARSWVGIGRRGFHWQSNHLLASLDFWEVHITQDHGPGRYLKYFPLQWPFSFFGNKQFAFLRIRDDREVQSHAWRWSRRCKGERELLRRLLPTLQPLTARHSCDADRQRSDQRFLRHESNGKWHTGQSLITKTASADCLVVLR